MHRNKVKQHIITRIIRIQKYKNNEILKITIMYLYASYFFIRSIVSRPIIINYYKKMLEI